MINNSRKSENYIDHLSYYKIISHTTIKNDNFLELIKILIIYFLVFALSLGVFAQSTTIIKSSKKIEIVYLADGKYASDKQWLKTIRDDWKATGINLRIFRSGVEKFGGGLNWDNHPYEVDKALNKIAEAGLDIYLRINLALLDIQDVNKTYTDHDYHIRSDGKRFLNQYDALKRPLLNVTSLKSRSDMLNFVQTLVDHLRTLPDKVQNRIRLIVPTLSPDDETEFPFNSYNELTNSVDHSLLSGFSKPEIESFMVYLKKKYGNIQALNTSWGEGAEFTSFESNEINIFTYNWDGIKSDKEAKNYFMFINGRKDFLDFRAQQLKKFIDDCSMIVREAGFRFGVQFGSIYDNIAEHRGFYDPTSLLENVDKMITADILEYSPNFNFSADLSRSLCNYWNWRAKDYGQVEFATEINWPGYAGHNPKDLIKYWSLQLKAFYERGASSLFVAQWGVIGAPNNTSEKILLGSLDSEYRDWKDTLNKYSNMKVNNTYNDFVYYLPCEFNIQHIFNENSSILENNYSKKSRSIVVGKISGKDLLEFPIVKLVKTYKSTNESYYYNDKGDFVTRYMLTESPDYLKNNYKYFFINNANRFIESSFMIELK